MPSSFRDKLRAELDRQGLTVYRLSKLTGISEAALSRIMSSGDPSLDTFSKISKALGVSCEALMPDVELPEAGEDRGRGRPKETAEEPAPEKEPAKGKETPPPADGQPKNKPGNRKRK